MACFGRGLLKPRTVMNVQVRNKSEPAGSDWSTPSEPSPRPWTDDYPLLRPTHYPAAHCYLITEIFLLMQTVAHPVPSLLPAPAPPLPRI